MENIAIDPKQDDFENELIKMLERREQEIEKNPGAVKDFYEAIEDIQKSL